jgi:acyl-CoA reductase-like NAD-dependent aldehyde dehydrogenase
MTRLSITKAYKMYVGGAFVRSESGRYFQVSASDKTATGADPETVNIPLGSRKDARDAVLAAKNAFDGWSTRTAFNRGQILYRLAEMLESRRDELTASLQRAGLSARDAEAEVGASVDRAIFYAGFCDKLTSLLSSYNPVPGPHFDFSVPDPMGVIAVVAPARPALLGLVSTILPVIAAGNTVVAIASQVDPRTAVLFCECLATSDLPGGVINVLTGDAKEIAPHLAKHREVAGIDAWTDDAELRAKLEAEGSDSVKRVTTHATPAGAAHLQGWHDAADPQVGQGLGFLERFLETKTIWHPVGV